VSKASRPVAPGRRGRAAGRDGVGRGRGRRRLSQPGAGGSGLTVGLVGAVNLWLLVAASGRVPFGVVPWFSRRRPGSPPPSCGASASWSPCCSATCFGGGC